MAELTIFDKNMNALMSANTLLWIRLSTFNYSDRFEIFQGSDPAAINFFDKELGVPVYNKPVDDTLERINALVPRQTIPFHYFFGLGNGIFFKILLKNSGFKRIVVCEPNLDLIYIVLNLLDFSEEIAAKRFEIAYVPDIDFPYAVYLFSNALAKIYSKLYEFEITCPYYEHFSTQVIEVNKIFVRAIEHCVTGHGNDAKDSLIGIQHHVQNLPLLVRSPKLQQLKNRNTEVAIIISTGPSLAKQLPLLREVAPYATLFSIDASLPILEREGIKPDFVLSIERGEPTSNFYKKTSPEFQKDVIAIFASLAHEETIKACKSDHLILAMRPFGYTRYFDLHEHGYIGIGMSAANMAHDLVYHMGYKTCILIGQDLAFGDDGTSHSSGHIFSQHEVKHKESDLWVERWGGGGVVRTMIYWNMFRNYFEKSIGEIGDKMVTINATEGGARIYGSLELTFREACEKYLDRSKPKSPFQLIYPTIDEAAADLAKAKKKISEALTFMRKTQKKIEKVFLQVAEAFDELVEHNNKGTLDMIDFGRLAKINDNISKVKAIVEDEQFVHLLFDVTQSFLLHNEMELATVYVQQPKDDEERKAKLVDWIMKHREWLFMMAGAIDAERVAIKRGMARWRSIEKIRPTPLPQQV